MAQLGNIKAVTVESNKRKEMAATVESFYSNIKTFKAAILFAVCRGKVSKAKYCFIVKTDAV